MGIQLKKADGSPIYPNVKSSDVQWTKLDSYSISINLRNIYDKVTPLFPSDWSFKYFNRLDVGLTLLHQLQQIADTLTITSSVSLYKEEQTQMLKLVAHYHFPDADYWESPEYCDSSPTFTFRIKQKVFKDVLSFNNFHENLWLPLNFESLNKDIIQSGKYIKKETNNGSTSNIEYLYE